MLMHSANNETQIGNPSLSGQMHWHKCHSPAVQPCPELIDAYVLFWFARYFNATTLSRTKPRELANQGRAFSLRVNSSVDAVAAPDCPGFL